MEKLKFVGLQSIVETGFWNYLTKLKLDSWKLDEDERLLNWDYTISKNFIQLDHTSLDFKNGSSVGFIKNFNTLDNFKLFDKKKALEEKLSIIRIKIENGTWNEQDLFQPFFICFADLKKYHYHYSMCFPTFKLNSSFGIKSEELADEKLISSLSNLELIKANKVLLFSENGAKNLEEIKNIKKEDFINSYTVVFRDHAAADTQDGAVGNIARNILYLLWKTYGACIVTLLSLRRTVSDGIENYSSSKLFKIALETENVEEVKTGQGWETLNRKLHVKKIDLSASMDPNLLAANAVDLNLKLMKWRLQPNIDLDIIKEQKILLLGSGTLGCNVARVLIGWGASHITFVDNGTVSFSNPVRQSLFTFQDSVEKKSKSEAAAAAIKQIAPMVETSAVNLSIPMPGHHISRDEIESSVATLEALIKSHDVIYLLMDTRESRWLPTVIGKMNNKLVINAALGFDTYMVMRHGVQNKEQNDRTKNYFCRLGCYFCNDVVAPANSTTDRTLDQQCTVSRPGLSLIASSLAVELMVSVLQHPEGAYAPSFLDLEHGSDATCLGPLPHQIRGFLSSFHTMMPTTEAFPQCTACSPKILSAYESDGIDFLERAFNSPPDYLEDLTGLSEMRNTSDVDVIELSDDDF